MLGHAADCTTVLTWPEVRSWHFVPLKEKVLETFTKPLPYTAVLF